MSSAFEDYEEILGALDMLMQHPPLGANDEEAKIAAAELIRELRKIIERLRRIVDDEQPPVEVHSLQDAMKLNKDELAYIAWQFFQWGHGDVGHCPAGDSFEFPCQYRRAQKAKCEENLKDGNLDDAGFERQKTFGFFSGHCSKDKKGCWAEYYLWCYRNDVNPLNGKKEKKQ